jgi:hypothetical protein
MVVCSYEGVASLEGDEGEKSSTIDSLALLFPSGRMRPPPQRSAPLSEATPLRRYAVYDISLTSMKASRRGFQFRSAATP